MNKAIFIRFQVDHANAMIQFLQELGKDRAYIYPIYNDDAELEFWETKLA